MVSVSVALTEPGELSSASLAKLSPSQLLRLLHCCSTRVVTQNPAITDKPRMPTPRHLLLQEGPACDAKEGYPVVDPVVTLRENH